MTSVTPRDRYATVVSTRTRRPAGLLAALVLAAVSAILLTGCGDSTALSQGTTPQGRLPRGGESGPPRPGRLHDAHRQPVPADGAREPLGVPGRRGRRGPPGGHHRHAADEGGRTASTPAWCTTSRGAGPDVEDTHDWFAQDNTGNVWYLGEATEYRNGKPHSTQGSWEAGVDGAQPGIAMPAHPRPGMHYRQEYRKGTAEDAAACSASTSRFRRARGISPAHF